MTSLGEVPSAWIASFRYELEEALRSTRVRSAAEHLYRHKVAFSDVVSAMYSEGLGTSLDEVHDAFNAAFRDVFSSAVELTKLPFQLVTDYPSDTVFARLVEDPALLDEVSTAVVDAYLRGGGWDTVLQRVHRLFSLRYAPVYSDDLRDLFWDTFPERIRLMDLRRGSYLVFAVSRQNPSVGFGFAVKQATARRVSHFLTARDFSVLTIRVFHRPSTYIYAKLLPGIFSYPSSACFFGIRLPVRYYDYATGAFAFDLKPVSSPEHVLHDVFTLQWFTYRVVPFFKRYWERYHERCGLVSFAGVAYGYEPEGVYGLQRGVDEYYERLCDEKGGERDTSWRDLF